MKAQDSVKTIRFIHRMSGLFLVPLMLLKLMSGFSMVNKLGLFQYETAAGIHLAVFIDIPLLLLFFFHAVYGILRILMPRLRNKQRAMLVSTGIAFVFFAIAMAFIYIV